MTEKVSLWEYTVYCLVFTYIVYCIQYPFNSQLVHLCTDCDYTYQEIVHLLWAFCYSNPAFLSQLLTVTFLQDFEFNCTNHSILHFYPEQAQNNWYISSSYRSSSILKKPFCYTECKKLGCTSAHCTGQDIPFSTCTKSDYNLLLWSTSKCCHFYSLFCHFLTFHLNIALTIFLI